MKESLIQGIQKFLNTPFKYTELILFLDKQKDFLLQKHILDKSEDCEYNALWDTVLCLENEFKFADKPNLIVGTQYSVLSLFNYNYKWRKAVSKNCA